MKGTGKALGIRYDQTGADALPILNEKILDMFLQDAVGTAKRVQLFIERHLPLQQGWTCVEPFIDDVNSHALRRVIEKRPGVWIRSAVIRQK